MFTLRNIREEEEEEEVQARECGWREGRGTEMVVRKLGGGGGSGISKAYSQPPSCDLIFVESGGKFCREKYTYVDSLQVIEAHIV